jgi:hypothetical protein
MLAEAGGEIRDLGLELVDLGLLLGQLPLVLLDDQECAVDERPHGGWGGGPIGGSDPGWRQIIIHSESMHAPGGAVNHPCGPRC